MACARNQNQKGFTLIELLVVISIFAFLASAVMLATANSRVKARDTKRIADLKTLATAIELYYQDNGSYPSPPDQFWSSAYSDSTYGWQNLQTALEPYIKKIPVDPLRNNAVPWGGSTSYGYAYGWVGTTDSGKQYYTLIANLEDTSHPLRCTQHTYKWHWHNTGITLCNNGGPGGWHYTAQGYQASLSTW